MSYNSKLNRVGREKLRLNVHDEIYMVVHDFYHSDMTDVFFTGDLRVEIAASEIFRIAWLGQISGVVEKLRKYEF